MRAASCACVRCLGAFGRMQLGAAAAAAVHAACIARSWVGVMELPCTHAPPTPRIDRLIQPGASQVADVSLDADAGTGAVVYVERGSADNAFGALNGHTLEARACVSCVHVCVCVLRVRAHSCGGGGRL